GLRLTNTRRLCVQEVTALAHLSNRSSSCSPACVGGETAFRNCKAYAQQMLAGPLFCKK
ncbi:hypothetical protein NPIL_293721, partial [Nephila pilipes]